MQGRAIFETLIIILMGIITLAFIGYVIYLTYNFIYNIIIYFAIQQIIR